MLPNKCSGTWIELIIIAYSIGHFGGHQKRTSIPLLGNSIEVAPYPLFSARSYTPTFIWLNFSLQLTHQHVNTTRFPGKLILTSVLLRAGKRLTFAASLLQVLVQKMCTHVQYVQCAQWLISPKPSRGPSVPPIHAAAHFLVISFHSSRHMLELQSLSWGQSWQKMNPSWCTSEYVQFTGATPTGGAARESASFFLGFHVMVTP